MFLSEPGKILKNLLINKPDEFSFNDYRMIHKPSQSEFWISNGVCFFDGCDNLSGLFGVVERIILWHYVKRCRRYVAAMELERKIANAT